MGERASSDFDAQHSAQGIQGQDSLEFVSYKDGKADAAALIGDVTTDKAPAPCWRLTWKGWRGGVAPARFATRLNEVEAMALALAAAACAAEAEVEGEERTPSATTQVASQTRRKFDACRRLAPWAKEQQPFWSPRSTVARLKRDDTWPRSSGWHPPCGLWSRGIPDDQTPFGIGGGIRCRRCAVSIEVWFRMTMRGRAFRRTSRGEFLERLPESPPVRRLSRWRPHIGGR